MVAVRLASSLDHARWDVYVQAHPQALLAHQFAWFSLLAEVFRIEPVYWLAEEADQVVGLAPFFVRRHVGLGTRLCSMPYLNTGGLLASSPSGRDALWNAVQDWAAQKRVGSIELRSRYEPLPNFAPREGRTASIISLPPSEDAAWDQMRSVARNRIRKAQKAGLTLQHGFRNFDGFWRAYGENMRALGAPVLPRRFFLALAEQPTLKPHLITVQHQGETVAGMVLLGFKDGMENGWTASTLAARALYCNDLLYWEAMRWGVAHGRRWLDLGRSQAGGGHEHFKEKFGAQTIRLPYQELRRTPTGWQAVTAEPRGLYTAFAALWKRLPLPLATRLGPYVSRQVY